MLRRCLDWVWDPSNPFLVDGTGRLDDRFLRITGVINGAGCRERSAEVGIAAEVEQDPYQFNTNFNIGSTL
jgi:hypothetical protein